jgi:hypothetical protein
MTAQKDGSSSQTRNEFGFGFGFGSFTVPTFSTNPVSSWFSKQKTATTVQPSSSLTGLPWCVLNLGLCWTQFTVAAQPVAHHDYGAVLQASVCH